MCTVHHHHVYWRLDFDSRTAGNNVVREYNEWPWFGQWHTKQFETQRPRSPQFTRQWQVRNTVSGESYTLIPGDNDGRADAFGVGDMWALRYRPGQIDDGIGFTSDPSEARAHLNQFLNGEPIQDTNVVLWYVAHFKHDVHDHHVGHIVGPKLVPGDW